MEISPTAASATPERPVPARLWNRNFFLLWQGQTVSQLGNQAFSVALMFWAMEATGSASVVGLLMTFAVLPGVILSPFGGTFADRYSRIRIIIVCDFLAGVAILGVAGAMLFSDAPSFILPILFAVAVLEGIIRSFFMPAIASTIPDLVPRERIAAANSLNQFSVQTCQILGQAVGGVLYNAIGAWKLFLFDGLTFLFSGFTEMGIDAPPAPAREKKAQGWSELWHEFLGETKEGLRYVWNRPGLRNFVAVAASINFFSMPTFVLFPFYVEKYLKAGADWYGFLLAGISAGSIAGFLLAGSLKLKGDVRAWTVVGCLVAGPLLIGAMGFTTNTYAALVLAFFGGAAFGMINIYVMTLLQTSTPPELRGRVLGLLGTLGGALMPIGMALGGWLGDLTDKNVPLIFGVSTALSVISTLLLATRPECRLFLRQD